MNIFDTTGIKYLGSKKEMLAHIDVAIQGLEIKKVVDCFSGSTRVSQYFKNKGFDVVSNDINAWSAVFAECFLENDKPKKHYEPLIRELNEVQPIKGWFTRTYGGENINGTSIQEDGKKRIWQVHVTEKLDGIRKKIQEWKNDGKISKIEQSVLLTSLILALDSVDSTLGHQVSYLKNWSARSYKPLILEVPNFKIGEQKYEVHSEDANVLSKKIQADLYYFDPPYGSNNDLMPSSRVRYGQYYHIWKTVILNDEPDITGKVNRRADCDVRSSYSVFEDYKTDENGKFFAQTAIEDLFANANTRYVLFSYNNNSRVPLENIIRFIQISGWKYTVNKINYKKNVMASMSSTKEWVSSKDEINFEVLILIDKHELNYVATA